MKRRTFLIGSAAVTGGVMLGGYRLLRPKGNPLLPILEEGQFALTPYVIVDGSGVSVVAPRAEMGQGIHSTLAALVAEELDVTLEDVRVIHGPASNVYANHIAFPPTQNRRAFLEEEIKTRLGAPENPTQLTGGQSSIQDAFVKMRTAGASARHMLVEAAAREFGAEPSILSTTGGAVVHPDGRTIPYTALAEAAATVDPPDDPPLKPQEEWTLLGRSQPRVDMVGKCTGTAEYSIDMRLPGMLYAAVRRNPHLGARMTSFDDSRARSMRGVRDVIGLDDGIIVVASNTWYAMMAAREVDCSWESAPYPASTEEHLAALSDAVRRGEGPRWRDDGDVDRALEDSSVIVEEEYHVPYLAHATMEPLNALAWLRQGRLDIWAGNQNPTAAQFVGAQLTGLPIDAVHVHTTYMGGGFGRRLEMDFVASAIRAAMALPGTPIQATWPREEDIRHDSYRPTAVGRFRGAISNGRPAAIDLTVSSPALHSSASRRNEYLPRGDVRDTPDKFSVTGVMDQPYRIDHYRVTAAPGQRLLPVGWWRSVGESQNTFFMESAIDEMAHAAGGDPLEMRRSLLDHAPSRTVLDTVAEMSGWSTPLPEGRARGVAYALSSGAATAQVVEVSRSDDGIRVERCWIAVDVGIALDPRNIEAQVTSAVLFGICSAIHGEITVEDGRVVQSNYDDYPLIRMVQAPRIDVHVHESGGEIYGVGESGTPTAAPALGNAIFAATGQRIRRLPFGRSVTIL
ncbi:MAG: molybdopterin cofactor-binding domain-containing protein [Gemmatimonadota bacterium]